MNKEDFLKYVKIDEKTGCWIWQLSTPNGYGGVYESCTKKQWTAHRFSYHIFVSPLSQNKRNSKKKWTHVCHKCDVRSCVNPNHLFLGTSRENQLDWIEKVRSGKIAPPKGRHWIKRELAKKPDIRKELGL